MWQARIYSKRASVCCANWISLSVKGVYILHFLKTTFEWSVGKNNPDIVQPLMALCYSNICYWKQFQVFKITKLEFTVAVQFGFYLQNVPNLSIDDNVVICADHLWILDNFMEGIIYAPEAQNTMLLQEYHLKPRQNMNIQCNIFYSAISYTWKYSTVGKTFSLPRYLYLIYITALVCTICTG